MRHNQLEDIGIIEVHRAITIKLGWIFRPQPFTDVGIDAIVEKSENGDPKGKFIAVQIKAGEGNFYLANEQLTYYATNVHYKYWTQLNIPIILAAYLPESDTCYWQAISTKTLKQTKTQWKVVIPMTNLLDQNSKRKIEQLLAEFRTDDIYTEALSAGEVSDAEVLHQTEFLVESIVATSNINDLIRGFEKHSLESTEKNQRLASAGNTMDNPAVSAALRAEAKRFAVMSQRLLNESRIFADTFVTEIIMLQRFLQLAARRGVAMTPVSKREICNMPTKIDNAMRGIDYFRSTVETVRINNKIMKKSRKPMLAALNQLYSEYMTAREITTKLAETIF